MSPRRTHRPTVVCAIVCALLAFAMSGAAGARTIEDTQATALAQEAYYSSYGKAATSAQERYYSSYGEPEPLTVAQSPAPSDDTPWLPITLSIAAALAIAAAGATQVRRVRVRRRGARVAT